VGGFTVWFTGLPSSGKSTLAGLLEEALRTQGLRVETLDGRRPHGADEGTGILPGGPR